VRVVVTQHEVPQIAQFGSGEGVGDTGGTENDREHQERSEATEPPTSSGTSCVKQGRPATAQDLRVPSPVVLQHRASVIRHANSDETWDGRGVHAGRSFDAAHAQGDMSRDH
jgi:hypothetical protein